MRIPSSRLGDSDLNVGGDDLEVVFGGADRVLRFHFADDGEIVEGGVSLAPQAVKEVENWILRRIEMLAREFENCDVMAELDAWTLTVAQHQGQ